MDTAALAPLSSGAEGLMKKALSILGALALGGAVVAQQPPSADERVAALKQSLGQSQAKLRKYEWIETTVVSLKGEEKSRKQNRCYHGADGKLQKVPVAAAAEEGGRKPRGLRGKIVEQKKEEMSDYMQRAVDLVHMYVPPDPARIQSAKDAGKVSLHLLEPGKRIRLEFRDYLQAGDKLGVEVDLTSNRLLGLTVASYLATPDDPVGLDVRMAALADGTDYAAAMTLDAKAKGIRVAVENSGYRIVGQ